MKAPHAAAEKARREVEILVDELVETIEAGVAHPSGRPGFRGREARQLRVDLGAYADATLAAARGTAGPDPIQASIDAAVDTIRRGVLHPMEGSGFGPAQAEELSSGLRGFADAIVEAAGGGANSDVDAAIGRVVRSIRRGLFRVYGRASYAAITGDQLEAYLQTFVDAVQAFLEKDRTAGELGEGRPPAESRPPATR